MRVTLNSKADKPVALISGSNWNLEFWFLWREENRRTRRKTLVIMSHFDYCCEVWDSLGSVLAERLQVPMK